MDEVFSIAETLLVTIPTDFKLLSEMDLNNQIHIELLIDILFKTIPDTGIVYSAMHVVYSAFKVLALLFQARSLYFKNNMLVI